MQRPINFRMRPKSQCNISALLIKLSSYFFIYVMSHLDELKIHVPPVSQFIACYQKPHSELCSSWQTIVFRWGCFPRLIQTEYYWREERNLKIKKFQTFGPIKRIGYIWEYKLIDLIVYINSLSLTDWLIDYVNIADDYIQWRQSIHVVPCAVRTDAAACFTRPKAITHIL
jgi:hypothetical protein